MSKIKSVASIDVGSHNIRMLVGEIDEKGNIRILDELRHHANIGKDTFANGKVSVDTIHEVCKILKYFTKVLSEYNIRHYRAVSTSGIREAKNKSYFLEQIRLRTGLIVEIINSSEERLLTFKAIRDNITSEQALRLRTEGVLIVNIGSGGVEISVYKGGNLQFTYYIKMGSLRLREMLSDLERVTLDFPHIMEEFIESKTYLLEPQIKSMKLKNFLGLGGGLRTILRLCNEIEGSRNDNKQIRKDTLQKLYDKMFYMTIEQMTFEYKIDYNEAQTLLPSIIIFMRMLSITEADYMDIPMVSLRHGLLADMVDKWYDTPRKQDFFNDILNSVKHIGLKYNFDEKHAFHVQNLALGIFDQLKRIHKLGNRERLYLQVAAILHDIGKYINLDKHHIYSYELIKAQNIMGFSNRELGIISNIVRYHGEENPESYHENYSKCNYSDQIIISKLSAILKLADALDITHKQKVKDIKIRIKDNSVYFRVKTDDEILLEKWRFINKAIFFEEVIGMKAIIKN